MPSYKVSENDLTEGIAEDIAQIDIIASTNQTIQAGITSMNQTIETMITDVDDIETNVTGAKTNLASVISKKTGSTYTNTNTFDELVVGINNIKTNVDGSMTDYPGQSPAQSIAGSTTDSNLYIRLNPGAYVNSHTSGYPEVTAQKSDILPTITSDATATAANILAGTSAYVNGQKIDGEMVNLRTTMMPLSVTVNRDGVERPVHVTLYSKLYTRLETATNGKTYFTMHSSNAGYVDRETILGVQDVAIGILAVDPALVKAGEKILAIKGTFTSDATATADQILKGQTAYVNGEKVEGTMLNFEGKTISFGPYTACRSIKVSSYEETFAEAIFDPQQENDAVGFYGPNTSIQVTISNLYPGIIKAGEAVGTHESHLLDRSDCIIGTFTLDGTATDDQILEGEIAYVKGLKRVGTMENLNDGISRTWCGYEHCKLQVHPEDPSQAVVTLTNVYGPVGYYGRNGVINANLAYVIPENIRAGVRVGRSPEYGGADDTNSIVGTFTSDATAVDWHILVGQSAYVNGVKVTGSMPYLPGTPTGITLTSTDTRPVYSYAASDGDGPVWYVTNSDGVRRLTCKTIWGFSDRNALIGLTDEYIAYLGGITPDKIVRGHTVFGVVGIG